MVDNCGICPPVLLILEPTEGQSTMVSPLSKGSSSSPKFNVRSSPRLKAINDFKQSISRQYGKVNEKSKETNESRKLPAKRTIDEDLKKQNTKKARGRKEIEKKSSESTPSDSIEASHQQESSEEDGKGDGNSSFRDDSSYDSDSTGEEDVDDARMIADMDPGDMAKQTTAQIAEYKNEKLHVELTLRTGKKITATAFAKGYFKMCSLTEKGKELAKLPNGMFPNYVSLKFIFILLLILIC
jgi:hypothetical protein